MQQAHGRRGGFTLIEVMAVIVIIILVAGLTTPTFIRTYRSETLRSEARLLMATVQQARYQAVVRQHPMVLNLNFAEQAYWVEASQETVTNLIDQVFAMSTNSLAVASNWVAEIEDLSTNETVTALPGWTRHEMASGVKLERLETFEGESQSGDVAQVTCYPSGASQGGVIMLVGGNDEAVGVQIDPLTSLPKLILDVQQ
ncbi:MAG: prepilin-type N-terminal cleavage/methylation domain-containing protein [Verrucomicrobia bacterium]|nr:prepilin-type N-terminal cleavage/methylation domain-containing protein [Verrucomicrobiota bacterium]